MIIMYLSFELGIGKKTRIIILYVKLCKSKIAHVKTRASQHSSSFECFSTSNNCQVDFSSVPFHHRATKVCSGGISKNVFRPQICRWRFSALSWPWHHGTVNGGGFQSSLYPQSHPFFGIFHEINHPAIGIYRWFFL